MSGVTGTGGVSGGILQAAVYRGANPPQTAKVGDLWFDTVAAIWKYCVSVGPVVFAPIDAGGGGGSGPTSAQFATLVDRVSANSATLTGEIAARIAGDNALSDTISAETVARVAADDALSNAILAEAVARAAADAALSNSISAEAAARSAADVALSNAISNEASARVAADNALSNSISAEAATRSAADAALSNAISNEASARAAADAALSNAISNEASVRSAADAALSNAISNEASARAAADAALSNSISGLTPSGTGIMVRLGASSTSARTIIGNANEISVGAGDGIAGNPTLGIPTTFIAPGTVRATGAFIAAAVTSSITTPTGGALAITVGAAATASSPGNAITVTAGQAGAVSGLGGDLTLTAGLGVGAAGFGGNLVLRGGNTGNAAAGAVQIFGGSAVTSGVGGDISLTGGGGIGNASNGGNIVMLGGPSSAIAGRVTITGGTAINLGAGGLVSIVAGSAVAGSGGAAFLGGGASQSGAGGTLTLRGGGTSGVATQAGDVLIAGGSAPTSANVGEVIFNTGAVERMRMAAEGDWRLGGISSQSGQVIKGGGPNAPPTWGFGAADVRILTGDQTFLATALANVSGQAFAVTAGQTYAFKFMAIWRSSSTAFGPSFSVTFPAAAAFAATVRITSGADGTAADFAGSITASGGKVQALSAQVAAADYLAVIEGVIAVSTTGSVQLQAGNEVSGGAATSAIIVRAGTTGMMWRIA